MRVRERNAHARLRRALDDALGAWHGIDLAPFAMLARLAADTVARVAPAALPAERVQRPIM